VISDGCGDDDDDAVGLGCSRVVVVVPLWTWANDLRPDRDSNAGPTA